MEDVLDLYEEEYDRRYPTVCFDEKLVAPEAYVRPAEAGRLLQRVEFHYTRHPWQLAQYGRNRDQYFCTWLFVASPGENAGLAPAYHHSRGEAQYPAQYHLVALYLQRHS
jgi:hypothetical protein